jgi:hypothetical protein
MRINHAAAGKVFDAALDLANGPGTLPHDWIARFLKFAGERTYSAVLATSLLARAVEPEADALILQAKAGSEGYNARGLFTQVIFERANRRGVPLGTIGREPHNNQPFYGHARIQDIDRRRLRRFSVAKFDELVESLHAANRLTTEQATLAFAAFLRVRLQQPAVRALPMSLPLLDASLVIGEVRNLIERGGDAGRRGEAVVAAAMDLVFPNVHLNAKANDPSRHWPGDVVALAPGSTIKTKAPEDVLASAEVKERTASEGEINQFASNLSSAGVRRGLYVALALAQQQLELEQLENEAWQRHRVLMKVVVGADALLRWALALAPMQLEDVLTLFAIRLSERLRQKESATGTKEWTDFLYSLGPSAGAVVPLLNPRKPGPG